MQILILRRGIKIAFFDLFDIFNNKKWNKMILRRKLFFKLNS